VPAPVAPLSSPAVEAGDTGGGAGTGGAGALTAVGGIDALPGDVELPGIAAPGTAVADGAGWSGDGVDDSTGALVRSHHRLPTPARTMTSAAAPSATRTADVLEDAAGAATAAGGDAAESRPGTSG
jgi:hypothetical protein